MASYEIESVVDNGAVVKIVFDGRTFKDFDSKGKPVNVNFQRFKIDNLDTSSEAEFIKGVEDFVSNKITEIAVTPVDPGIVELIGNEVKW